MWRIIEKNLSDQGPLDGIIPRSIAVFPGYPVLTSFCRINSWVSCINLINVGVLI
jgi:hypothetical protein